MRVRVAIDTRAGAGLEAGVLVAVAVAIGAAVR